MLLAPLGKALIAVVGLGVHESRAHHLVLPVHPLVLLTVVGLVEGVEPEHFWLQDVLDLFVVLYFFELVEEDSVLPVDLNLSF